MGNEILHLTRWTCDRCEEVVESDGENVEVPSGWHSFVAYNAHYAVNAEPVTLCGACTELLNLFLSGASVRKPRKPSTDAATP